MLNFEKMRKLIDKMKQDSFAYTENFLQKVFESMEFNEDYIFIDGYETNEITFPDGADPNGLFENIVFSIEYDFSGTLKVMINNDNFDEAKDDDALKYIMIQEVLLKNGFSTIQQERRVILSRVI